MNILGTFGGKAGLIDLSHFFAHCLCVCVGCLFLEKIYLFIILNEEWNSDSDSSFHVVVANFTMT